MGIVYFIRFVLFCTDLVSEFLDKNCPYMAGAISFYTLFSLFPLILAMISIAGFVLGPTAERDQLAVEMAGVIPVSAEFISDTMQGVVRTRAITGIASVLGLLWASTSAFGAMRKGINAAWGIRKTRPFLKERLIDFSLTVSAGLLMLGLIFIAPTIGFFSEITSYLAQSLTQGGGGVTTTLWHLVAQLITPIITFGAFLVLYRFLPNTKVTIADVWMGALLGAVVFESAKWGFVTYVRAFPAYNAVYGPVSAIMALLTWVYLSAMILLFCALLTSRHARYLAKSRKLNDEKRGLKLLWAGLSRVRLRDVVSSGAEAD
ncbi:MAG: YihY/virulence factor BrkB family protein [Chloroflexi bacterium]|nr:YihY/virulence factor BrkB family protein [Chloroflexota bacterium]